uniref:Uncharacterized protein n=1 Tax=Leucosporidium scottii TaxID=5278 RepID=A0A0H5FUW2_9BASI|nr:hypothetical protein [Leucosporidium scottii]
MLARTSTLAIVASLAAFIEVKKINDDKFKKTKFNVSRLSHLPLFLSLTDFLLSSASQQVHDATEHDKNFNQIDAKNKDVLKAVDFRKDDDDFFYKRGLDSIDFIDSDFVDSSLIDTPFIGLGVDTDFIGVDSIDDVSDFGFGILRKRWDGDGEDIKFIEVKAVNEDKFKKTNFNVHDRTEHDKNFNQVEAKDKDVLKVVDFRKDDDDFDVRPSLLLTRSRRSLTSPSPSHTRQHFRGGKFGDDYY